MSGGANGVGQCHMASHVEWYFSLLHPMMPPWLCQNAEKVSQPVLFPPSPMLYASFLPTDPMQIFAKTRYLPLSLTPVTTAQTRVNEEMTIAKECLSAIIALENIKKLFCPTGINLLNALAAQCSKIKPGKVKVFCSCKHKDQQYPVKKTYLKLFHYLTLFQSTLQTVVCSMRSQQCLVHDSI